MLRWWRHAARCGLIIDSCCDLPPDVVDRPGVELVRFPFVCGGDEFLDDLWQSTDMRAFYGRMRKGASPTTSHPAAAELRRVFERSIEGGVPAVYLSCEWAHRLPGVEVVDGCSRGKQYVRFRTKSLEEWFPPVDGSDNWGQRHYWFYEMISRPAKDGVGCDLSLQLCFHLPKNAPFGRERAEASHAFTDAFSRGDNGTFHGTWTGYCGYVAYFSPGDFDYDGLAEVCDIAWDDFMQRERDAISVVCN